MPRSRSWVWLQIIIAWLPVWALYALLVATAHPDTTLANAALSALWAITVAASLGVLVQRLTERFVLTRPIRLRFFLVHVVAALVYSALWVWLTFGALLLMHGPPGAGLGVPPPSFLVMGVWLYLIVAGASYATQATERAGRAEALAANSRLAALRAQLNPHFLFNALHTVIHLIPREPRLAATAAEQLAGLLRTGIEEDRDLIALSEEVAFVERYLSIEQLRFGDRLEVRMNIMDDAKHAMVPSFSLQSLVENAVRHGAEPREEKTTIEITASKDKDLVTLTVRDSGIVFKANGSEDKDGTGIPRLRERLAALYGSSARLDVEPAPSGWAATMVIPYAGDD